MKTRWHLLFVAALLPVAGAVHASSPLVGGLESTDSFDEALRGGSVELTSMKVFNEIPAECSGKISAVLVENGAPVEYGQKLFRVEKG